MWRSETNLWINWVSANVYKKVALNFTTVENKFKDMQNVQWKYFLPTKPKLRTYVKFKENICTLNNALLEKNYH